MRVIAELTHEPLHVSELARRVGMSRALLYMHTKKLEEAGFISSELVLSDEGKAMRQLRVEDFRLIVNQETIRQAVETFQPLDNKEETS
jgi:DNA-binding MarR family transcriptional regulator